MGKNESSVSRSTEMKGRERPFVLSDERAERKKIFVIYASNICERGHSSTKTAINIQKEIHLLNITVVPKNN